MSASGDATALDFVRRSLAERRRSQQSSDVVPVVESQQNRTHSKSRPTPSQPPRVPSPQSQRTPKANSEVAGDAARREHQQQCEDDDVRAYWAWLAATSAAASSSASSPLLQQQAQQQQQSDAPRRISYYAGFLPDALDRAELPSALRTTTRTSVDLSNTTASPIHGGERACESVGGAATSSSMMRRSSGNTSRRRRTTLSANFADTASGRSHSGTFTQSVTFDETLAEAMVSTSQRMKGHQLQQQRRRSSAVSVHSGGVDSDEGEGRCGSTFPGGPCSRSMSAVAGGDASHREGERALTWASGSLPPLSEVATILPLPPSLLGPTRRTTPQSPASAPRTRTGSNSYCSNSGDLRAPPLLSTPVREVKSVGGHPRNGNSSGDAQLSHHQLTEAFYGSYQGGKMARDAYLYFISKQQQQQQQRPPPSNKASKAASRQRGSKGSISKSISSGASAPSTRRPTQRRSELRPHLLSWCFPAEPPADTGAAATATSTRAFASPPLSPAALAKRRLSPTPTATATGQRATKEATRPVSSLTSGEYLLSDRSQKPRTPPQPRPLSALHPLLGCVNGESLPALAKQYPPQPSKEDTTVAAVATAAVSVVPAPAAPVDDPTRRLEELWRRSERIFQQRQQGP